MGALLALAARVLGGTPARAALTGVGVGTLADDFIPGIGALRGLVGGGDGRPHRHRRRKMFTDTDLAQFAAAEAIGGKKTAAALMMIRAAKA